MSNEALNIVSFTVPFPANYGGVIDVFYKIKSLHQLGVKIHLHCFKYDREEAPELEKYCEKIHYYSRKMSLLLMVRKLPFIVESRVSNELVENLAKNDYPILFEGLHTCGIISDDLLKDRVKIVRSHNIEHDYYTNLAQVEKGKAKKIYFNQEARKLRVFEEEAYERVNKVLGISKKDTKYLDGKYGNAVHVSAFHQFEEVNIKPGKGDFVFYHGNLEVGENNEAALFLVNEVFSKTNRRLKIAGNGPSKKLIKACEKLDNVELLDDLTPDEIIDHLENAQINLLPTFQSTGIKLKLLAALHCGRHCLVNEEMIQGTGLRPLCELANTPEEMLKQIEVLWEKELPQETAQLRAEKLEAFSNLFNAKKILELL